MNNLKKINQKLLFKFLERKLMKNFFLFKKLNSDYD